jgi:hypothetical protein
MTWILAGVTLVGGLMLVGLLAVALVAARRSVTLTPEVPPEWQPRTWGQPEGPGDLKKPRKEWA